MHKYTKNIHTCLEIQCHVFYVQNSKQIVLYKSKINNAKILFSILTLVRQITHVTLDLYVKNYI